MNMETAFTIDWLAPPTDVIVSVAAKGNRLTTMLDHRNCMVWHRWGGSSERLPLILLHGGWGSWTHWIKCIPALSARTVVLAADTPGMGDSDGISKPHTVEAVARLISSGIENLLDKGERYDIAGFSFGGMVAAHVAALQGDRCNSFTAVGAAGFGSLHHIVDGIHVPDPRLTDTKINAIHAKNLKLLMLAREKSIDPLAIHIHRANIERGRLRSRQMSLSNSLIDILPNIKSKIGGIWGALDTTGNGIKNITKRRDIFRAQQPDSPFDILENSGHWVMYEKRASFLNVFNRHLDSHNVP